MTQKKDKFVFSFVLVMSVGLLCFHAAAQSSSKESKLNKVTLDEMP